MSRDTGGPAHPTLKGFMWEQSEGSGDFQYTPGMTLRDYFAGQALAGEMVGVYDPVAETIIEWENDRVESLANRCYKIADAMIAERNKP